MLLVGSASSNRARSVHHLRNEIIQLSAAVFERSIRIVEEVISSCRFLVLNALDREPGLLVIALRRCGQWHDSSRRLDRSTPRFASELVILNVRFKGQAAAAW